MKRIIWLIPFLAIATFAGYYHHWNSTVRATPRYNPLDKYKYLDGHEDAKMALARGQLVILTYGLPVHWWLEYREVLKRDYDVEMRTIAGCMVTEELVRYAAAYNAVMERRIAATLGNTLFDEAAQKAEALYTERHPRLPQRGGMSQP